MISFFSSNITATTETVQVYTVIPSLSREDEFRTVSFSK